MRCHCNGPHSGRCQGNSINDIDLVSQQYLVHRTVMASGTQSSATYHVNNFNLVIVRHHKYIRLWNIDRTRWKYNYCPWGIDNESPISSVQARYTAHYMSLNSDQHSANVTPMLHTISCYIGPSFNRSGLYWTVLCLMMHTCHPSHHSAHPMSLIGDSDN